MLSSVATLESASKTSSRIEPPNALSFSGRLSLIVSIGPSSETMIASYIGFGNCAALLAPRRVRDLHFFELLVLNLDGEIKDSFDSLARLILQSRSDRILLKNNTAQMYVPLLVRLNLFS